MTWSRDLLLDDHMEMRRGYTMVYGDKSLWESAHTARRRDCKSIQSCPSTGCFGFSSISRKYVGS
jgi:hypothetical protein